MGAPMRKNDGTTRGTFVPSYRLHSRLLLRKLPDARETLTQKSTAYNWWIKPKWKCPLSLSRTRALLSIPRRHEHPLTVADGDAAAGDFDSKLPGLAVTILFGRLNAQQVMGRRLSKHAIECRLASTDAYVQATASRRAREIIEERGLHRPFAAALRAADAASRSRAVPRRM